MARKTARLGRQTPTQALVLPYDETKGGEAVELYEQGGRTAMDWQKVLLYDMMAVDDDGLWVHSKFGLSVPRRNGKSEVDKMRELRGLFHSEHTLHTAHRTTKPSAWIFTHVPLAGDDHCYAVFRAPMGGFLSTAPLRGTTVWSGSRRPAFKISIHIPLAGDDGSPTSSCCFASLFLSTSPLRGTTANVTENTVYFPAHLSQQDTAYKNTLRFCAVCGRFRGASARSALKMLCSPVRTARRFSAR